MKHPLRSKLIHSALKAGLLCLLATSSFGQNPGPELSQADKAEIENVIAEATTRIETLANGDANAFTAILQQSYGARLSPGAGHDLGKQAARRHLPLPARILFVPSHVIDGAGGAYATENGGAILLNAGLRSDPAALQELLIHEWGHHLDSTLGPGDAPGEEGSIFQQGVYAGGAIPLDEYRRLVASKIGHSTIVFEGRTIDVELGCPWYNVFCHVGKAVTKVAEAVVDGVEAVGNVVVAGVQATAAGVLAVAGEDELAAALINEAGKSIEDAGSNALDFAAAAGDVYHEAVSTLDNAAKSIGVPIPLGSIADFAVSLSPLGPYVAGAKGLSDINSAIKNGGDILGAVGFAALDVGMQGIGRATKAIDSVKSVRIATKSRVFVTVANKPDALQKIKNVGASAKQWFNKTPLGKAKQRFDQTALTKPRKFETKWAGKFNTGSQTFRMDSATLEALGYLHKVNFVVRPKDFIGGRGRDDDGLLLGTGGSLWTRHLDLMGDYINNDNESSAKPDPGWLTVEGQAINCPLSGCIASGPGCTDAVPGQCSFAKNEAVRLCLAHDECRAVTCNDGRNDCQARSVTYLEPWPGFTSHVPQWKKFAGQAINCPFSGCIASGPGCNTEAAPGQCSFPKDDAIRLCAAFDACRAITCNDSRTDCQARSVTTLEDWPGFTSHVPPQPTDKEKTDLAAKLKADKDAADLAAVLKAEKDAAELAAKQKAASEAALAAQQEIERQAAALLAAQEKAARDAAALAAQQEAERQAAALLAAQQQAARDAAALAAQQEAERQAAALLAAQQQAARDAAALAAQQEAERQAAALLAAQQQAARDAAALAAQQEYERQAALAAQREADRLAALAAQQEADRLAALAAARAIPVVLASGSGEFVALEGTFQTAYQIFGHDGIAAYISMNISDNAFQITIDQADLSSGQLSPCEGGNCPCRLQEAQDGIQGSCTNLFNPDHGLMTFNLWYGEQPAVTPSEPQMTIMATATGEFNDSFASFEFWGVSDEPSVMRITVGGQNKDIYLDPGQIGNDVVSGQMTPCDVGVCPCEIFEEGENYYMGSCETGDPNRDNRFSFRAQSQ